MNKTMMMGLALVLASLPMTMLVTAYHGCPNEPTHTYGTGGSASANSASTFSPGIGFVSVTDTNAVDCNTDGIPGDWDGDYDSGIGGAFHGYGQWATDPDCDYDIHTYGATITVADSTFAHIAFVTGADQTFGPTKIPIDEDADGTPEGYICTTDGIIDGDDPTGNDCISQTYITPATGTACGEGGDGGIWTFVSGIHIEEAGGNIAPADPATIGTITAS